MRADGEVILGATLDGHRSRINNAGPSFGSQVRGSPTPNRRGVKNSNNVNDLAFRHRAVWEFTSSIVSMKTWASSPERSMAALISLRSEKMDVIRRMRSSLERGKVINCFQVGRILHAKISSANKQMAVRTDEELTG